MTDKRLILKLGSQCNWNCPHCHNEPVNYPYNDKIIQYIKENNYTRITFSGGEPLLYWNTIVKIVTALGKNYTYRIVTNGSLMDREKVTFIGKYNISVIVSFDGSKGHRTNNPPVNWRMLSAIPNVQFSVVVYDGNMDFDSIYNELVDICKQYRLKPKLSLQPEFIHQTSFVKDTTDINTAKEYCQKISKIIEKEIVSIMSTQKQNEREQLFGNAYTLKKALGKWLVPREPFKGCRCFNESIHCMSLDGRFLLCPYSDKRVIGNIEKGIDWHKADEYIPEKCKKCNIFSICRGACIANVTENECYIARTMNRWLEKVCARYKCKEVLIDLWKNIKYYKPKESI